MKIRVLCLIFLCLVFLGHGKIVETVETDEPRIAIRRPDLIAKLLEIDSRDKALSELLRLNKNSQSNKSWPCQVNHIVICPQKDGSALYAVFKSEKYEKRYGGGHGKPLCHVIIFDKNGKIHPFYSNANSINGVFADVNGDGIVENIESWGIGGDSCPGHEGAKVLHVIPITTNPIPLLCIAYNPINRKTKTWSWRAIDTDGDGILEIQLGPVVKIHGKPGMNLHDDGRNKSIKPVVTYKWSTAKKAYVGPKGGNDKPYKKINSLNKLMDLKSFDNTHKSGQGHTPNNKSGGITESCGLDYKRTLPLVGNNR